MLQETEISLLEGLHAALLTPRPVGAQLLGIGHSDEFLAVAPKTRKTKPKQKNGATPNEKVSGQQKKPKQTKQTKTKSDSQIQRTDGWLPEGRGVWGGWQQG